MIAAYQLPSPACRHATMKGFTLVELMVAAVISSVLLLLLVQVTVSSQDLWMNLRRKTDAAQETRALVALMQSDLKAMYTRGDRTKGVVPMYVTPGAAGAPSAISFLAVQESLAQDPSSQSAAAPKSDVCIVSYHVDATHAERPLVRTFSDSNATYTVLKSRIDAFIDPANPAREDQTPTKPELADQTWKDAATSSTSGTPSAIAEQVGLRVMAFEVVPMRLRRPVASPTGAPMTPLQLQDILTGRIAGNSGAQWPLPASSPEHEGALPDGAVYDPDYSAPDVVQLRLVVADAPRLASLGPAEITHLADLVQRDVKDGQLDGKSGEDVLLSGRELQGLSYATTNVAINNP